MNIREHLFTIKSNLEAIYDAKTLKRRESTEVKSKNLISFRLLLVTAIGHHRHETFDW